MKKATLSGSFSALRADRKMTLLAVANACDLAETTVLKVESGKSVRWETLHLLLSVGLRVLPGTERYDEFHRLWLMHRAELAESKPPDHSRKKLNPKAADAVKKFRTLIRDLDDTAVTKVLAAATNAAAKVKG
jgi:transcriptional regulator with XRE-family HTH domain